MQPKTIHHKRAKTPKGWRADRTAKTGRAGRSSSWQCLLFVGAIAVEVALGVPAQGGIMVEDLSKFQAKPPDIFATNIDVAYEADTGQFTAEGLALKFDDKWFQDGSGNISPGLFQLMATIDAAGDLVDTGDPTDNTLTIEGTVPALGFNSGVVLTGDITDVAPQQGGSSTLNFLFTPTGGDALALFTNPSGIVLSGNTGFDPAFGFTVSFASDPNTSGANADTTALVPEASSFVVWGLLAIIAAAARQWRTYRTARSRQALVAA